MDTSKSHFFLRFWRPFRAKGLRFVALRRHLPRLKREIERRAREDPQMWRCEDVDLQMWRCEDVDLQMWRCEDVDLQMWRCEDVDLQMWGCEECRSAGVSVWRCRSAGVRVWRCRSADVRVWRCRSADVRVWRCMWGCEDVDQQMWGCEDVDQQMWGCEDVDQQMWGCEDVDQQMWGCEDVLQRLLFYKEPFAGALGKKCNKPLQQLIDSATLSQSNWDPRCDRSPFLESSMWHQSQPVSLERDRTCYRSNRQSTPSNENESTKEPTGGIGWPAQALLFSVL